MKFLSWNVNGIRSILGKGFWTYISKEKPDIFCLQETKAQPDQVGAINRIKSGPSLWGELPLHEYEPFWNSAEKKGYSGTSVFTKIKPHQVTYGMNMKQHDNEGRIITLEFDDFFLVNVYTPNSQRELTRLQYRMQWDKDFLHFLKKLESRKPVIFCGDLNVAHTEIDLARPKDNHRNAGFTDEEREGFSRIINSGFVDSFRVFNTEKDHYTWWSYMHQARSKNIGWRIDYFCLSQSLKSHLKEAFIHDHVMGSDHCPVGIEFER